MPQYPSASSYQTSRGEAIRLFLENVQGYYAAQYNVVQEGVITGWLASLDPAKLDGLYREIVRIKLYQNRLPLVEHYEQALEILDEKIKAELPDPGHERARLALAYREEPTAADEEIKATLAEILANMTRAKRFTES